MWFNNIFNSNSPEAVQVQYLMGVEGVIVDLVQEVSTAVACLKTGDEAVQEENTEKMEQSILQNLISQVVLNWSWVFVNNNNIPVGGIEFG